MNNGYDAGYAACECFWGREPGSLVVLLASMLTFDGLRVLDAGCGEGKNAEFLAARGADVTAVDASELAIQNARCAWPTSRAAFSVGRVEDMVWHDCQWDIVVMYGLLHCLPAGQICNVVTRLQAATVLNGYHVVCAFNDRAQDLSAHPGFTPTLLPHDAYRELYASWDFVHLSDRDLRETHPHNKVEHTHSMTRLLARRRSPAT